MMFTTPYRGYSTVEKEYYKTCCIPVHIVAIFISSLSVLGNILSAFFTYGHEPASVTAIQITYFILTILPGTLLIFGIFYKKPWMFVPFLVVLAFEIACVAFSMVFIFVGYAFDITIFDSPKQFDTQVNTKFELLTVLMVMALCEMVLLWFYRVVYRARLYIMDQVCGYLPL